jgi:hypothetical protein
MTQTTFDLSQYFERDIIEFLDKKKDLQTNENKNASSEMLSALESNNVALASKLIEDEVVIYNRMPTSSFYKEQEFKKIIEMHRQSKEFIKLNPLQCRLKEDIDLLTNSKELEQGAIDKITALDAKINESEELKISAKEKEKEFARKINEQLKDISGQIVISIKKRDLVNAIKNYKDLKIIFEQYSSTDIEKKQDVYNDLLSFFMQIKKLKKELEEDKIKMLSDKRRLEISTKKNINNYLRLADLKELVNQIKYHVKNADFNSATQKTIEMRQIINRIPDEYKHIRGILNSKLDIIIQRIEFVKRIKNHN